MGIHKPVTLTVANLQAICGELTRSTETLRVRIEMLGLDGIESLPVTNHDQLTRAMEYLENFSNAIRKAHIEKKKANGEFGDTSNPKRKRNSDGQE